MKMRQNRPLLMRTGYRETPPPILYLDRSWQRAVTRRRPLTLAEFVESKLERRWVVAVFVVAWVASVAGLAWGVFAK